MAGTFRTLSLISLFILLSFSASLATTDPFPKAAKSYLLTLQDRPLWAHQPEKILPPASLTKVMTAIIVLKNAKPDDIVKVDRDSAMETGSRMGIRPGDRFYVKDLLSAMLIKSANDACHALADHVGGDEARFVSLMNKEALEMRLRNTHFENACGHDSPGHYSSASDILEMAERALKNPLFSKTVSIERMKVRTIDGRRAFLLRNHNKLIGRVPGVYGVKTGFTRGAGKCLITYAERNGKRVFLVLLNSPNRWRKAPEMLKKAFTQNVRLQVSRR